MLRRTMCPSCPFRGGFGLRYSRRVEIRDAVMRYDATFHCHKEVDYRSGEPVTVSANQCAGATTLALREGAANQAMRWSSRLGREPVEDEQVHAQRSIASALEAIGKPAATPALPVLRRLAKIVRVQWAAESAIRAIE